ncbi:hypothetical protein BdPhPhi1402_gp16 [Bdellovibrio phage phi1402]|uniref:hypothetical protein n=1 Tax=Bdellovibrio phage phi1402 TaxID=1035662 RepID=UPI000211A2CE|nr:hypothetical protein BdPhPhi1402_gp16 [Bdellovibrio phage phi1402]AEG42313.1 hypothetical protein [Bdellovibrio phage phi1402]
MAKANRGAGPKPASAPPAPKPEAPKPGPDQNEGNKKENLNSKLPEGKTGLRKFDKFN